MKNLIVRALSGALFLVIMASCILLSGRNQPYYLLVLLFCFLMIVGMIEVFNMFYPKENFIRKGISVFVCIAGMCGIVYVLMYSTLVIPRFLINLILLLAVALAILKLYSILKKPSKNVALIIIPIFYIVLPFLLMFSVGLVDNLFLLSFFILVWSNDVGAYCFGMLLGQGGKHKLFPRISPKKTWEGFFGGVITAVIAGILISKFILPAVEMYHWIIIAILTSVFGTFGDLTESMLKRCAGVKDSGKIMPGHGGVLDRFDAALLAFPVVFVYLINFL